VSALDASRAVVAVEARAERAYRHVVGLERELWVLAATALVADLALTIYGLEQGYAEANPLARAILHAHGYPALVVLKAWALGVGVGGWLVMPRAFRAFVPLALAVPWTVAVLVNAALLGAPVVGVLAGLL
jgi:hypothetical protein